jgi:hypothetical protein
MGGHGLSGEERTGTALRTGDEGDRTLCVEMDLFGKVVIFMNTYFTDGAGDQAFWTHLFMSR